jgi:hypothetical protein
MATVLTYFDLTGRRPIRRVSSWSARRSPLSTGRDQGRLGDLAGDPRQGRAICWAETTETRTPDMPAPPYKVVIDKRPEK